MSTTAEYVPLQIAMRSVIKKARITQGKFSSETGIDHTRVRNIMTGRVKKLKFEEVCRISSLYNINHEWLISGKGKRDIAFGKAKPFHPINANTSAQLLHHLKHVALCIGQLIGELERTA